MSVGRFLNADFLNNTKQAIGTMNTKAKEGTLVNGTYDSNGNMIFSALVNPCKGEYWMLLGTIDNENVLNSDDKMTNVGDVVRACRIPIGAEIVVPLSNTNSDDQIVKGDYLVPASDGTYIKDPSGPEDAPYSMFFVVKQVCADELILEKTYPGQ